MNRNYYMIITTKVNYKKDIENNFDFLGFSKRNKMSVKNFKRGCNQ